VDFTEAIARVCKYFFKLQLEKLDHLSTRWLFMKSDD